MDKVFIEGLEIEALIGIYDWERRVRQPLVFDIEMGFDNRIPAASDAIADTLDYKAVSKRLIAFVSQSGFGLVETLAERCAAIILQEFGVQHVRLKLSKPGAVRGARAVGVTIERSRATTASQPLADTAAVAPATPVTATAGATRASSRAALPEMPMLWVTPRPKTRPAPAWKVRPTPTAPAPQPSPASGPMPGSEPVPAASAPAATDTPPARTPAPEPAPEPAPASAPTRADAMIAALARGLDASASAAPAPATPSAAQRSIARTRAATCPAYLSLGSNIAPEENLRKAVAALRARFGDVQLSPVYRTRAVGFDGPDFLNCIAIVQSDIHPFALNDWLHALEVAQGRDRRDSSYSNRTLDIDIIYFGDLVLDGPNGFQLPRPELRHAFVLKPLADIAPTFVDPVRRASMAQLWAAHPQHDRPPQQVPLVL